MQTITMPVFLNYRKMLDLHKMGQAKPIGKVDERSEVRWISTDVRQHIVNIGLVFKTDLKKRDIRL